MTVGERTIVERVPGRTRVPGVLHPNVPKDFREREARKTDAERQRLPNDYEAQVGQGPITLHSEEHPAAGDRGLLRSGARSAASSRPSRKAGIPINVSFEAEAPPVVFTARRF